MNKDKAKGAFFGLAIGDAIGTTVEFKERDTYEPVTDMVGGGVFRLQPGEWTDDTSMALALAQTLVDHGMNKIELLKNFTRWYRMGEFSHNGKCFDIGNTTRKALEKFIKSEGTDDSPASIDSFDSGNGGIMRLAPAVLYARSEDEAIAYAIDQSAVTHASPDCMKYTSELGHLLWRNISDNFNDDNKSALKKMINVLFPTRDNVKSSGYVEDTYFAAMWSFVNTDNFRDAILLATNLGDDADTVAAVTGQIAGAYYGYSGIPEEWIAKLAWKERIEELTDKLVTDE